MGGQGDNSGAGAAWVYTRSGGVWTQQGSKLVGTGAVGDAEQGGPSRCPATATPPSWGAWDNSSVGAAWVYTRSGGSGPSKAASWSAPARLEIPTSNSVALSADGNTAVLGGPKTTRPSGRRGSSPAAAVSGPSKAASWLAPARLEEPYKAVRRAVRRRQHRHRGRAWRQLGRRGGVGLCGSFTLTIPACSFAKAGPGYFTFVGVINNVSLNTLIRLTSDNNYISG